MTGPNDPPAPPGPTAVVLARTWGGADECAWVVRQVAGALACHAQVHVITPQGKRPRQFHDGVFVVHELASASHSRAELRRDLLLAVITEAERAKAAHGALPRNRAHRSVPDGDLGRILNEGVLETWHAAEHVVATLQPDVVALADFRQLGALTCLDRVDPSTPVVLIPLGTDLSDMLFPHFAPVFDRASTILVFTESERRATAEAFGEGRVRIVGPPMSANASVWREPNTQLGETEYILVSTGCAVDGPETWARLGRLLRLSFPGIRVAIASRDAFDVWYQGKLVRSPPMQRGTDVLRTMAWARLTVDLKPGRLLARRCIESLLYATPIVVPAGTRAQEHAESGNGGLWFETSDQLIRSVDAIIDAEISDALGKQGRSYAETRYGSTQSFITQICSLAEAAAR